LLASISPQVAGAQHNLILHDDRWTLQRSQWLLNCESSRQGQRAGVIAAWCGPRKRWRDPFQDMLHQRTSDGLILRLIDGGRTDAGNGRAFVDKITAG
jgi:hypothetical protein